MAAGAASSSRPCTDSRKHNACPMRAPVAPRGHRTGSASVRPAAVHGLSAGTRSRREASAGTRRCCPSWNNRADKVRRESRRVNPGPWPRPGSDGCGHRPRRATRPSSGPTARSDPRRSRCAAPPDRRPRPPAYSGRSADCPMRHCPIGHRISSGTRHRESRAPRRNRGCA